VKRQFPIGCRVQSTRAALRAWRFLASGSLLAGTLVCASTGCTHHTIEVQPIRIEPMFLTVDVNLRLDRQLEESFGFEDRIEQRVANETGSAATLPASAPATAPVTAPVPAPVTPPTTNPANGSSQGGAR
jgi:hypothetical protein